MLKIRQSHDMGKMVFVLWQGSGAKGRSRRQQFPDHAFMPHCTFSPHLLAQQGVRRAPEGEGALAGGI